MGSPLPPPVVGSSHARERARARAARSPGAAFSHSASSPLRDALAHLHERRLAAALEALAARSLEAAVNEGLAAAAEASAARPIHLAHLLPASELSSITTALSRREADVAQAAPWLESRLEGVALEPSQQGLVSTFLQAIAAHLDGAPQAALLRSHARDLGTLEDELTLLADRIDRDPVLTRLRRRRAFVRAGALVAVSTVALSLLGSSLYVRSITGPARARVDRAIEVADPCARDEGLADALRYATDDQRRRLEQRASQCTEKRAREAHEADLRARAEADERARRAAREARASACTALATHVEHGALDAADAATAGPSEPLLRRVAARTLLPADLAAPALPCDDTDAGARLWAEVARLAAANHAIWTRAHAVSPGLSAQLARKQQSLPAGAQRALWERAEQLSRSAALAGSDTLKQSARSVCDAVVAVGMSTGQYCNALAAR